MTGNLRARLLVLLLTLALAAALVVLAARFSGGGPSGSGILP